jgi:hypothetical protein
MKHKPVLYFSSDSFAQRKVNPPIDPLLKKAINSPESWNSTVFFNSRKTKQYYMPGIYKFSKIKRNLLTAGTGGFMI